MLSVEQALNGLQYGMMLFLMAAGLTLVFGVMGLINPAAWVGFTWAPTPAPGWRRRRGQFALDRPRLAAAAAAGAVVEVAVIRRL